MQVKDLYIDGKGIFYYMNKVKPLIFSVTMDIGTMDLAFISIHGIREISSLANTILNNEIAPEKMESLAKVILGLNIDKWENLFNVMTADLPLETYKMVTTESVEDSGESESNISTENTNTDSNKVTGYNSPDFVDDEQTERVNSDLTINSTNNLNNRQRTSEVKGNKGNIIDDRVKALDYLNKSLIYDIIFVDISTLVGTLIY